MAYHITTPQMGYPQIGTGAVSTVPNACPVGTVCLANDSTYGGGEFIFLPTVSGQVVGSLVYYNTTAPSTTLAPNTADLAAPVAVAMDAYVAGYAWFQIGGAAVIKKTATKGLPNNAIFLSATAGRIVTSSASGKAILGARTNNTTTVTTTTSTLVVTIDRPHLLGLT